METNMTTSNDGMVHSIIELMTLQRNLIPILNRQHHLQYVDESESTALSKQNTLLRQIIRQTKELMRMAERNELPN